MAPALAPNACLRLHQLRLRQSSRRPQLEPSPSTSLLPCPHSPLRAPLFPSLRPALRPSTARPPPRRPPLFPSSALRTQRCRSPPSPYCVGVLPFSPPAPFSPSAAAPLRHPSRSASSLFSPETPSISLPGRRVGASPPVRLPPRPTPQRPLLFPLPRPSPPFPLPRPSLFFPCRLLSLPTRPPPRRLPSCPTPMATSFQGMTSKYVACDSQQPDLPQGQGLLLGPPLRVLQVPPLQGHPQDYNSFEGMLYCKPHFD